MRVVAHRVRARFVKAGVVKMPDAASLYPPSPTDVPANLAKPGLRYRLHVVLVLFALLSFLLIYLCLLAAAVGVMYWMVIAPPPHADGAARYFIYALRFSMFAVAFMLFVFLFKWLWKRVDPQDDSVFEITEEEQPEFFAFLRTLCREIACPVPERVILNHEVSAAVINSVSLKYLVVPPRKSLLIGLGLVDGLNLLEFKAVIAHELGHYSQKTMRLGPHASLVFRAVSNVINVRDRWDYWVITAFDTPWLSAFAMPLYALAELSRTALRWGFQIVGRVYFSLRRQMEFNADLVAVSVTGSDAIINALYKLDFKFACHQRAVDELIFAAEQGYLTKDVLYHAQKAAGYLRKTSGKPNWGILPDKPTDASAPAMLFQTDEVSKVDMWDDHPSNFDRERNAKARLIRCAPDERPAWSLFRNPEALRMEATLRCYESILADEPDGEPTDPERVQEFIEQERVATKIAPHYLGLYEDRFLDLPDIEQLMLETGISSDPESLREAIQSIDPARQAVKMEDIRSRQEELSRLNGYDSNSKDEMFEFRGAQYAHAEAPRLAEMVQSELTADFLKLADFDRKVFQLHDRLAGLLGKQEEIRERYRFQIELQAVLRSAAEMQFQARALAGFVGTRLMLNNQFSQDEITGLSDGLESLSEPLSALARRTRSFAPPAMSNLKRVDSLAKLLPAFPKIPSLINPGDIRIDVGCVGVFCQQLSGVVGRINWLMCKSLVDLLNLQERLVAEWKSQAEGHKSLVG